MSFDSVLRALSHVFFTGLGINSVSAQEVLKTMSVAVDDSQPRTRKMTLLGSWVKPVADETLFLALALRGYDLTKRRDDETTGEIVKIG